MSEDKPETMVPIDVESFNRISGSMKLLSIGLNFVSATVNNRAGLTHSDTINPALAFGAEYMVFTLENLPTMSIVTQNVQLTVGTGEIPDLSIQVQIQLDYVTPEPFTDEFFKVFKGTGLVAHVYPYAREVVQNLTMRMNIPVLTLPLIVQPTTLPEGTMLEAANTDVPQHSYG